MFLNSQEFVEWICLLASYCLFYIAVVSVCASVKRMNGVSWNPPPPLPTPALFFLSPLTSRPTVLSQTVYRWAAKWYRPQRENSSESDFHNSSSVHMKTAAVQPDLHAHLLSHKQPHQYHIVSLTTQARFVCDTAIQQLPLVFINPLIQSGEGLKPVFLQPEPLWEAPHV